MVLAPTTRSLWSCARMLVLMPSAAGLNVERIDPAAAGSWCTRFAGPEQA